MTNLGPYLTEQKSVLTISAVGDIMLSRKVGWLADFQGTDWLMGDVEDTLAADIVFGNLESVISDKGSEDYEKGIRFRAKPETINALRTFDVLSIANNHSYDWGREAWEDSKQRLQREGFDVVGNYQGIQPDITTIEASGKKVGIIAASIVLGENDTDKDFEPDALVKFIKKYRSSHDLLLLSIHWGEEYEQENQEQKDMAHKFVDAGVDVIIGHHPHVLQSVEEYKGKLIFYSLGNFLFDQWWGNEPMKGAIAKITVDGDSLSYEMIPTDNFKKKVTLRNE